MLQVARLAPRLLGESAGLVREFLLSQQNDDGGFKDRTGRSDLYYTVFGIDGLLALQAKLPVALLSKYLRTFGAGERLDFVHLCCLARCWAAVWGQNPAPGQPPRDSEQAELPEPILHRIKSFRARDGGFSPTPGNEWGSAYGCFLGLGAYQDLKVALPEPERMLRCLGSLETTDGAWANERPASAGSTNATAAAVAVLRQYSAPIRTSAGPWLLARSHPQGGFLAAPNAPLPDLLSTATALHALAGLEVPLAGLKEQCLDFIDSLWTNTGSFHGYWADDQLDCEYTFYGLLALGHLSVGRH